MARPAASELVRDLHHALRSFRRSPFLTAAVVLILAVGLGVTTALFSVADAVLLRPLPLPDADRVVIAEKRVPADRSLAPFESADLATFRARNESFAEVGGVQYDGAWPFAAQDGERAFTIAASSVSGDFFNVLDAEPAVGRLLQSEDGLDGGAPVAVLSYAFWIRNFGGDTAVVGRSIRLLGESVTIVGVGPRGFEYPRGVELWSPNAPSAEQIAGRLHPFFSLIGRLRPGVSAEQAGAELTAFLRHQEREVYRPDEPRGHTVEMVPLRQAIVGDVRTTLLILLASVGLVLVIATINVSSLLLVRAATREREFAVRAALGASRARIAQLLLVEGSLLALAGGALGLVLATWSVQGLVAAAPRELPRIDQINVDDRVLLFASCTLIIVTLAFALAPALWAARRDVQMSLRGGVRAGRDTRASRRGKDALVVAQVALAIVVLSGAGLLLKTLARLNRAEMGFDASEITVAQVPMFGTRYRDLTRRLEYAEQLVAALSAAPGIAGVTPAIIAPFSGAGGWNSSYSLEGQGIAEVGANPAANYEAVLPNYFATLGIPLRRGRAFTDQDRDRSVPVTIVSEAFARRAWPGQDPLGKRLKLGGAGSTDPWITVVGIVGETRYRDLAVGWPTLYFPLRQEGFPATFMLVRSRADLGVVAAAVRRAVAGVDPDERVYDIATVARLRDQQLARPRFASLTLGALAAVSLLLAATGLFGLLATLVAQRTHEMGVRRALGATTGDIGRLVLAHAFTLVAIGGIAGAAIGVAGAHASRAALFEVSPADPWVYVGALSVLAVTTLLAALVPTARAARVAPAVALRSE